jgi:hypothetical protein
MEDRSLGFNVFIVTFHAVPLFRRVKGMNAQYKICNLMTQDISPILPQHDHQEDRPRHFNHVRSFGPFAKLYLRRPHRNLSTICGYFITEICTAPNTVIYSNTVDQFNNQGCCISEPCTFVNDMGNPESGICMVPNSIEAQQAPAGQPRQPSDCIEFSGKIITLDVRGD